VGHLGPHHRFWERPILYYLDKVSGPRLITSRADSSLVRQQSFHHQILAVVGYNDGIYSLSQNALNSLSEDRNAEDVAVAEVEVAVK
jgi:hypothetical protein